jgi:transcriptional regulator with XRE-family HTH domain
MTTRETKARRARLGRAIRAAREGLKLSQDDLGAAAGLQQTDISKLEAGKRELSPFQLGRLAHRLGLTVDALLSSVVRGHGRGRVEDSAKHSD